MYKIPANTVFLGKRLVFVPDCHSTNTLALQLAQNSLNAEGTVVITDHQTAGRGQQGKGWESAPGMNLTFSLILKPSFLSVNDQYYLTITTSLALHDYLGGQIGRGQTLYIKWPNDILVHEKKICGILIENQLQGNRLLSSVVGVGLNVNQTAFETESATSLQLVSGRHGELETCLHDLLGCIEARFLQLRGLDLPSLKEQYLNRLYRINEKHTFAVGPRKFQGIIRGIDGTGKLVVETSMGRESFGVKEIRFLQSA